jgi:TP901 family phage tail tape measure protein
VGFSIGDLYLTLLADGGRLKQSIEQEADKAAAAAGRKVGKTFADRFAETGKSLQQTGTTLTRNVTAPILGLGAAVIAVGTQFDTTLRQIVALTDVTGDEIAGVRERLLELAPVLGKSPQELAEGFYFLASAGFTTAEALEVLETTAKASAAGLGTTADISRVIGSAINAFGKENLTAADATDQLIRAINKGTAEAPEFANSLGNVLGTAAQVGATFGDTTAAIAGMTLAGIGTEEATTSLNQVMLSLLKTTPQAEAALQGVGLSAEGLREQLREKGLLSVLQTLSERFEGNDTAAAEAFGNVRALRGVLALTGLDAAQLADVFESVNSGTQNLADAFAETEGPGREVDRALAEIQVLLIELAADVLPQFLAVLRTVVGFIHAGVEAFKSLPEPVRAGIVTLIGLAAAIGPLLFLGGKLVSGVGAMVKAFTLLRGAGSLLAPVIGKVVNSLASSPAISGAAGKVGSALGSTLGKSLSVAFAAVAIFEVIETYNRIKGELDAMTAQIAVDVSNQIKAASNEALEQQAAALRTGIDELSALWYNPFAGEQKTALEQQLAATEAELVRRASLTPTALANELEAGKDEIAAAAEEGIEEPVASTLDALIARARAAGRKVPESLADGILERQSVVPDAMGVLRNLIKNALTPAAQIARDIGILTSKKLAEGLESPIPEVRDEAQRVQSIAEQELAELIAAGGKVGEKAMDKLRDGLHSGNPEVRAAAQRVKGIVDQELRSTERSAAIAGRAAARAFAAALKAGFSTKIAIIASMTVEGRQHGGHTDPHVPYLIGERGPEIFVPETAGTVLPNQFVGAPEPIAGAGDTFNLYLPDAHHTDPWTVLDRLPRYAKVARASARQTGWSPA